MHGVRILTSRGSYDRSTLGLKATCIVGAAPPTTGRYNDSVGNGQRARIGARAATGCAGSRLTCRHGALDYVILQKTGPGRARHVRRVGGITDCECVVQTTHDAARRIQRHSVREQIRTIGAEGRTGRLRAAECRVRENYVAGGAAQGDCAYGRRENRHWKSKRRAHDGSTCGAERHSNGIGIRSCRQTRLKCNNATPVGRLH